MRGRVKSVAREDLKIKEEKVSKAAAELETGEREREKRNKIAKASSVRKLNHKKITRSELKPEAGEKKVFTGWTCKDQNETKKKNTRLIRCACVNEKSR